jgi:hypothetical protein
MNKEYQNVDYIQLGFDQFGLNRIQSVQQIPANLADYVLELSEYSVSNKKVKSISADKLTAGTLAAVTNIGDESIQIDGEDKSIKFYDDDGNVSIYMKGGSA